jgi:Na+/pantothenate symporter
MTHPALLILAKNPEILADHAEAYTDLIAESLKRMMSQWRRRAVCDVAIVFCMMLSVLFAGVAAMLWGTSAGLNYQGQWLLIGIPVLPLIVAFGLWQVSSKRAYSTDAIEVINKQVRADLAVLRQNFPS